MNYQSDRNSNREDQIVSWPRATSSKIDVPLQNDNDFEMLNNSQTKMELNYPEPKESVDMLNLGNTNNASQNEFEDLLAFNNFKASLP
jgi:hypothetical protein